MLARSNQAKLWGLILPGREHSKCKGPGVRRSLACLRNEKVSVAWAQEGEGRGEGRKSERCRGHFLQGHTCCGKMPGFWSNCNGKAVENFKQEVT